jgi:hypothetical protein
MMTGSRRWFLKAASIGAAAWLAGCDPRGSIGNPTARASRFEQLHRALSDAAHFLVHRQSPDGGWRSEVYGPMADGMSLTPLVLRTLQDISASTDVGDACRRGAGFLASLVEPDGTINVGKFGVTYPVYTSAGAVQALRRSEDAVHRKSCEAWLAYLRERQLTEDLGWHPGDKQYGGWGYCPHRPLKPTSGEPAHPLTESNLSATVSALEALHAAGLRAADPLCQKALSFVRRCQNYGDGPGREPAFDDGGFFFIYDDAVRNKAGIAGEDGSGRRRFASYGSATADGLRALLLCGLPAEDARVRGARAWLEENFRVDTHPGKYAENREAHRDAVYYYYGCSLARTLHLLGVQELETPKGTVRWEEVLADELVRRQRPDGSWLNPVMPQREDDPLVATSFAALALAHCR